MLPMMMTIITRGGEGRGDTRKESKATKSEGRCLEEGPSRALMRQVGEEGCGGIGEGRREALRDSELVSPLQNE